MKTLSAQEQEREKAWNDAKSRIMKKAVDKMLDLHHAGCELRLVRMDTHEKISVEEVIDLTLAVLKRDFEQNGIRPTKKSFAENCPCGEVGQWVRHMWTDPFRRFV